MYSVPADFLNQENEALYQNARIFPRYFVVQIFFSSIFLTNKNQSNCI